MFSSEHSKAVIVCALGVALYSVMDALMKGLSIAIGAYDAALWRSVAGIGMTGLLYGLRKPRWPPRAVLKIHLIRGSVAALLVYLFFWGVARLPLAEGIALSFIAPLLTLYLAAVLLGERVGVKQIGYSVLGLAGVAVILAGRLGGPHSRDAVWGAGAVLLSALAYSYNLILQRQQAQLASPEESAFFGAGIMGCVLALAAPWQAHLPPVNQWAAIFGSALFASCAFLLLSWAYARAEAKVLVNLEYTAFIWAAILGFLIFHEPLSLTTLFGAGLIVIGCGLAARREKSEPVPAQAL